MEQNKTLGKVADKIYKSANIIKRDKPLRYDYQSVLATLFYLDTARDVIKKDWQPSQCPTCEEHFYNAETCNDGHYKIHTYYQRCPYCGQALEY